MFGPRIGTVFASRWKALCWSAGVLLTAYCSVPAAEAPVQADAASAQEVEAIHQAANALEHLNDPPSQD